jgi:hypothetical protein
MTAFYRYQYTVRRNLSLIEASNRKSSASSVIATNHRQLLPALSRSNHPYSSAHQSQSAPVNRLSCGAASRARATTRASIIITELICIWLNEVQLEANARPAPSMRARFRYRYHIGTI